MDELELDEVASKDLAPSTQCDTIVTKTPSSVLNNAHMYVSVCGKVLLLKVR
jgi:hypothetical protein